MVDPLDAERTSLLTGAVREGLLSVEKHAGASTVVVSIGPVDGGVQVAVADDGGPPGGARRCPDGAGLGVRIIAGRARGSAAGSALVRDEDGRTLTLRMLLPGAARAEPR